MGARTGGIKSLQSFIFFSHVLLVMGAVPLLLRLNLSRLGSLLEPKTPRPSRLHGRDADQIVRSVDRLIAYLRPFIRSYCLTRGIVLYYLLRRVNVPVTLCFGAGKVHGKFVGHCWLARNLEPFEEKQDPTRLFMTYYVVEPK